MKILFTIAHAIEIEFLIIELLITSKWPLVSSGGLTKKVTLSFYGPIKLFRNIKTLKMKIFIEFIVGCIDQVI
jgi:hypothetical protein